MRFEDWPEGDAHLRCREARKHVCLQPSGRICIEAGCEQPAGTPWTPVWCPDHDLERMERVTSQLTELSQDLGNRPPAGEDTSPHGSIA